MPNKSFLDIVFEETKTEDREPIILDEGLIPFTPFIAYSAFKKKIFNSFKNNKVFTSFRKAKEATGEGAREKKGQALTAREKLRATFGTSSGGTVYKLTKMQVDIMADIYNKYGSALVKEIIEFRRKVLAPYELIKRIIKKSSRVSSKDVTGVSKEEFTSALESGKKKIASRGEYSQNIEGLSAKLDRASERVSSLEGLKQKFNRVNSRGVYDIDYNIVNRVMRKFGIEEAPEGYTISELKKVANEITRNAKEAIKNVAAGKLPSKESIQRRIELGKISMDLTKKYKGEFFKGGSFNAALGKMFFSHEIYNQLINPELNNSGNVFRQTYVSILDEMISQEMDLKKRTLHDLIELKKGTEFSDKENKVWGKRPGIVHKSGKEEDYYQKVKEEDFLKRPLIISRSEELIKAEQKIENEIKKFELKLRTIMDKEDYDKLKKYRVVGNLITIKELKNAEDLFKTKEELEQFKRPEPETDKETSETPSAPETPNLLEQIKNLGKSIINKEYEDTAELNQDVNRLRNLISKYKDQDQEADEKLKTLSGLLSSIDNKINVVKGKEE